MIVTFALVALYFYTRKRRNQSVVQESQALEIEDEKNPLEFKVALLFAVLFVAFTIITHYALIYFGDSGLRVLSVIVGVTDINPFIINLFQTQHAVAGSLLILATFQAMISNSFVNMIYGVAFSGKKLLKDLVLGASVICAVNILILVIFL